MSTAPTKFNSFRAENQQLHSYVSPEYHFKGYLDTVGNGLASLKACKLTSVSPKSILSV